MFEILFWFELSKKDHSREGSEVASALILKSICPSTSQKCSFIPRGAFLFRKNALLFSKNALWYAQNYMAYDFYVFYSHFRPHDNLENAVSEHLE